MKASPSLSRRSFLLRSAAISGGLMLEVWTPVSLFAETKKKDSCGCGDSSSGAEVTAWISIHTDDKVTIRIARTEMGQGSFTGLAMLVAEELGCTWSKVSVEYASTTDNLRRNRVFGDMLTGGSRSIRDSQEYLRKAGAA